MSEMLDSFKESFATHVKSTKEDEVEEHEDNDDSFFV